MSKVHRAAKHILSDIRLFSQLVIGMSLYGYQQPPLLAIVDSVLHQRGLEFLLVFSRQSGKNEAVAHLQTYLLNLLQRKGGNIVFGAIADGIGRGIDRLEQRLDNKWNTPHWGKKSKPTRRTLGKAAVAFLSTHPSAASRGETAHHLLIIDEMQDQSASHIEQVFEPMRAANNATAVYIGTVKLSSDALWQKKRELEAKQERDGIQRVFFVGPDRISHENPAYGRFLAAKIAQHGRNHPIIASEYFLEPIDGAGGLFPEQRRALMRGTHARQSTPDADKIYLATIDVGGQDEATTDLIAALDNPARDYTTCTIFEVIPPTAAAPGPTYRAVDIFTDQGSRHFQSIPGRPSLANRLNAYLDHWNVIHTICDKSGVGEGLTDWLISQRGDSHVTGIQLHPVAKAAIGSTFVSVIETGRFKYWTDEELPLSDSWWFWKQTAACQYELKPDGRFERDLRWGVKATHKTDTPTGPQLTHDDRLLSAALCSCLDELWRNGDVLLGRALSEIIPAADPLENMSL